VEDLIMQAHTNAGQVLVAVEGAGFLRDELKHLVDGTDTDRYAQQVTQGHRQLVACGIAKGATV
jgi:hypothetical protein